MKKSLKAILTLAASLTAFGFIGCGSGGDDPLSVPGNGNKPTPSNWPTEVVKILNGEGAETETLSWQESVIPEELLKQAKPGARLHIVAEDNGTYCKVYIMDGWGDSGIKEAYFEGDTENMLQVQTHDDDAGDVYRTFFGMSGEDGAAGEFYFVFTEASLEKALFISGNAIIKKCWIEYVGGKKEITPPPADPVLPEGEYEETIKLEKNKYAETPQTQVKVDTGLNSYAIGDTVTVHMKGVATKAFKSELYIVDTSEEANFWTPLTFKYDENGDPVLDEEGNHHDGKVLAEFGETFDITETFKITGVPAASASKVVFAINGLDGDETILLGCTEFSITTDGENIPEPVDPVEPVVGNLIDAEVAFDWESAVNGVDIAAEKLASVEVGTKIVFEMANGPKDYSKFRITDLSWNTANVTTYYKAADDTECAVKTTDKEGVFDVEGTGLFYVVVTEENIEKIKGGISFHGSSTLKSVVLVAPGESGPAEGGNTETTPLAVLTAWGTGVQVENLNYAEGTTVVIVYKDKTETGAFKLMTYDWNPLTSAEGLEGAVLASDGALQPNATEGTIKYVMTAADVEACLYNQFVLQGEGITIVSLTVE